MDVRLAGHNVDRDLLLEIRRALESAAAIPAGLSSTSDAAREAAARILAKNNWTPETLSAAYARISRDPRPIDELRANARDEVDTARRSNEAIIFGLGHASVAEHAVFNLDITGVSRLAVEEIQRKRLCSYTEKSQRYVLLDEDFVVPEEVRGAGLERAFRALLGKENAFYRGAYEKLLPWVFDRNAELAASKKHHRMLEGLAKEDARYGLSLATTVQLGETLNARNLEALIARTAAHPLAELREFSRRLGDSIAGIAPSVVKHTEPDASRLKTEPALRTMVAVLEAFSEGAEGAEDAGRGGGTAGAVGAAGVDAGSAAGAEAGGTILLDLPDDAEIRVVASLLHSHGHAGAETCRRRAEAIGPAGRRELVMTALHDLSPHDSVLREFEHAQVRFELIVSASCFAQLKRHRMATLTAQDYDPRLGVTVPSSFAETGLTGSLDDLRREAESLHGLLLEQAGPAAAAYVLLNAHRRRVILGLNVRELYHVARLRCDAHAQWDIRQVCERMLHLARERIPGLLLLACGKDRFAEMRRIVFGDEM
jgi:flavin-dependent thymidylate synthase